MRAAIPFHSSVNFSERFSQVVLLCVEKHLSDNVFLCRLSATN